MSNQFVFEKQSQELPKQQRGVNRMVHTKGGGEEESKIIPLNPPFYKGGIKGNPSESPFYKGGNKKNNSAQSLFFKGGIKGGLKSEIMLPRS